MITESVVKRSIEHANSMYDYARSQNLHKVNNKQSSINKMANSYCCGYLACQKDFYDKLLASGLFWEFYPMLSGNWVDDMNLFV